MKIKLIDDWSDRHDHPKKGAELKVIDTFYSEGEALVYECEWNGETISVYPFECREI